MKALRRFSNSTNYQRSKDIFICLLLILQLPEKFLATYFLIAEYDFLDYSS